MTNYTDFKTRIFKSRPDVKRIYNQLGPKYEVMVQVVKARNSQKLTQNQLAKKIGTRQSAIARFESGNTNPSLDFLQKLATALKTPINISVNP